MRLLTKQITPVQRLNDLAAEMEMKKCGCQLFKHTDNRGTGFDIFRRSNTVICVFPPSSKEAGCFLAVCPSVCVSTAFSLLEYDLTLLSFTFTGLTTKTRLLEGECVHVNKASVSVLHGQPQDLKDAM